MWSILIIGIGIFTLKIFNFQKNRHEKLYLLNLSSDPIRLSKIGFIMNELNPDTRKLIIKKGAFSKSEKFEINNSIWELKIDFRSSIIDSTNSFLIFGKKGPKNNGAIKIECALKKEQVSTIIEAESTLVALNNLMVQAENSEINSFRQISQSSLINIQKIRQVKNEMVLSMKHYGDGMIDNYTLFREIYSLDEDEVNYEVFEKILEQRTMKEQLKKFIPKMQNYTNMKDEMKDSIKKALKKKSDLK